ncbi:MAG: restriction endonuclease subunit S [Candidatus Poribacteria bacterium]|nr:restriction endonuclease subunit S [Candidatus Poribacteria bacterium]
MNLWRNITVGNLGEIITGYTPPTKNTEFFGDKYPFITPTDITMESRSVQTERFLSQEGYEYNKNRLLAPNSVCVTCIASIGKICMTTVPSVTNQQINSIVVNQDQYDPYFVYYLLITKTDVIQSVANSATTPIVNKSTFASIHVCVPPLPEQTQIANFLDRKTGQIDELIRIKERQIELLQEQRTVLINQAVTKGLDPHVEMKPSGVEWIGEIPRHWEVLRTKHVGSSNPSKNNIKTACLKDELVVFLPMERVHTDGTIDQELRLPYSQLKNGYTYFEEGDILIAKVTPCFENGKIIHIKNLATSVGFGSTEFIVIRPDLKKVFPPFLHYILYNAPLRSIGKHFMTSAIGLKRVPTEFVENFRIPIPTYQEQQQIANFLSHKTKQIDELIAAEQQKIELLKEYRQSLISEAVTGKIDVRNEV